MVNRCQLLIWTIEFQKNHPRTSKFCNLVRKIALFGTGCDIPYVDIGKDVRFPHLLGIVLSSHCRIGSRVTIYHQTTIGVDELKDPLSGPTIGDGVFIGAGAIIIGSISIGNNSKIGAGAIVTKNIPPNSTVIGINTILGKTD